ncbi:hypothetical protein Tco_0871052 [Tanacetum coccineum]
MLDRDEECVDGDLNTSMNLLTVAVAGTVNVVLLDELLKAWIDKKTPLFMKPKALDKKDQEGWVVCVKKFDDIYEIIADSHKLS